MKAYLKLAEVIAAASALAEIQAVPLPAKAAYRIARLIERLSREQRTWEQTQQRLLIEAGAERKGPRLHLPAPEKLQDESEADFKVRAEEFGERMRALQAQLEEVLAESVEIDLDPLPLDVLGEAKVKPADMLKLLPFVAEPPP